MPGAKVPPAPNGTAVSPVSESNVVAAVTPEGTGGTSQNAASPAPAPNNQNVANRATQSK
jgi:hypothetical protein